MPNLGETMSYLSGKFSLENLLAAVVTLLICLLAIRLLTKLLQRLLSRSKLEERIRRYLLSATKLLLYTLTVIFTAGSLGVNMNSLVALLSVGGLGITLAAEDILGNVAGGLVILSSHPFALGDYIESGGAAGTVEEISLNHTRLLTPDGYMVLLPNKELAASKVINYTSLGRRRIVWKMTAAYSVPTEAAKDACWKALRETPNLLEDPAPTVFLTNFGENGIDYTVYCWTKTGDWWPTQFALAENLRNAFAEAGAEIPYNRLEVQILNPTAKQI